MMGVIDDFSYLGDPAGMEALAAELLLRAESIAGIAQSLDRQVATMTFEGPAARELRADMDQRRRRALRIAEELQASAHALKRGASQVWEQIEEARLEALRRASEPGR